MISHLRSASLLVADAALHFLIDLQCSFDAFAATFDTACFHLSEYLHLSLLRLVARWISLHFLVEYR